MMEDEKGIDHKIIAVPLEKLDPHFKGVENIEDINQHLKKEIEVFFQDYKNLETKIIQAFFKQRGFFSTGVSRLQRDH